MNLYADIYEIYDYGNTIISPARRVVASNFIDKILFAHPDAPLLYWTGNGPAQKVPGLPPDEHYRGVNVFQGYIIVWVGNRLKWSSPNDFTDWIPVKSTATSFVFKLAVPFTRGKSGHMSEDFVYVDSSPLGLVSGQFVRIDSDPNYDFFTVGEVLPVTEQEGSVAGFIQIVEAGARTVLFVNGFVPYKAGARLYFDKSDATLLVTEDAADVSSGSFVVAALFDTPAMGDTVDVSVTALPQIPAGSFVSVGPAFYTGQDIYFVEAVDLIAKIVTLRRTGIGLATSGTHQAGEFIIPQPYVSVENISPVPAVGGFLTKLKERWGFRVQPVKLTGASLDTKIFSKGTEIFTVDANGAGEVINAGASINGEIIHFETLSDYGYIVKRRSIQSVQYVGPDQGTFYIRPEITDEGLLGDYAFVKVGLDKLYFWGNKEIYSYAGGNQLVAIGQQHTKQLFAEVNKAKANEIIGFHNEKDQEVWFIYPRKDQPDNGPLRVFIYNYVENSCTIDDYSTALQAITAAGRIEWSEDVIWSRALGTWEAPLLWPAGTTWDKLSADVSETFNFLGVKYEPVKIAGPAMLVHGAKEYSRLGEAIESVWETADFDGGDELAWKYIDTVFVSLQVKAVITGPALLEVYVGTKKDFDDTIVWSDARTIRVEGDGNYTTKINARRSGKYVRLRFRSSAVDIQWRVSKVRILGRTGGEY